jgi:hypothetical protein
MARHDMALIGERKDSLVAVLEKIGIKEYNVNPRLGHIRSKTYRKHDVLRIESFVGSVNSGVRKMPETIRKTYGRSVYHSFYTCACHKTEQKGAVHILVPDISIGRQISASAKFDKWLYISTKRQNSDKWGQPSDKNCFSPVIDEFHVCFNTHSQTLMCSYC